MVDDEIDFLQAIAERLTLKDFDVIAASTGREAIAAAENDLFDVAVVDFQMPGMDGTKVLKALKDRHRYLEIIMLTGMPPSTQQWRALNWVRLNTWKNLMTLKNLSRSLRRLTRPDLKRNSNIIKSIWKRSKSYRFVNPL